jgi:hypothetical protein
VQLFIPEILLCAFFVPFVIVVKKNLQTCCLVILAIIEIVWKTSHRSTFGVADP